MTNPEPLGPSPLKYDGVSKSYKLHFWQRPTKSLNSLSLEVRPGEILGLLGPNGAGKTTAIKLALGLIFPDEGRVTMFGHTPERPSTRERVGYLPENPYFPDDLTGRELVDLAGRLYGLSASERKKRTNELLERVGILHAADRPLRKYSKGMVQRAAMARALIGRPQLVILDEPMSGLDPVGRREFRDLIIGLREEHGATVLFASHVLSDVEMLCDRVAILRAGELVTTREMSGLQGQRRLLHWEVEVEVSDGVTVPGSDQIATQSGKQLLRFPPEATPEVILAAISSVGGRVHSLVPCRERLEDLFLEAVRSDAPDEPDGKPRGSRRQGDA